MPSPGRERPTRLPLIIAASLAIALAMPGAAVADETAYQFGAPVFDIAATPRGGILVSEGNTIREIFRGSVRSVTEVPVPPTDPPSLVNGLVAVGARTFYATSGGGDLAEGAALWRGGPGGVRLVADITAFETQSDPDVLEGPQWKHPDCEAIPPFNAGPQSNPYHLTRRTGNETLVADAAGNTLLSARGNGRVDLVAVFTPPVDESGKFRTLFPLDAETDCYVQPVPTAVDIGPDGAYYVGELTGAPAVPGWSRVWRIRNGSSNIVCPSAGCTEVLSGLTSVIDLEFAPDGYLYVVEYDQAGWLAAVTGAGSGGAIKRCDVETGSCSIVQDGLLLPGALTWDKWGGLWLLEDNLGVGGGPTVYRLALPD